MPYDRATHTYWSQIGSFALEGPLLGSAFVRGQSVLTKWATWKKLYPQTKVLGRPIGTGKNYNSNPYSAYAKTDRLLYDSCYEDHRTESPYVLKDTKEITFVVFTLGGNVHLFANSELVGRVNNVNDLDDHNFMVVYDSKNTLTYAYSNVYNSTKYQFVDAGSTSIGSSVSLPTFKDKNTGSVWNVSGICTSGPLRGAKLTRLTSFSTYWAGATSFYPKAQIWIDNSTLQYFPTSCPKVSSDTTCSVPCSSIVAAGPAQDAIESIDSPYFISPEAFESIVRIPRRTVTYYALVVSFFCLLAASLYGYNFYQRCFTTPPETVPLAPLASSTNTAGPGGPPSFATVAVASSGKATFHMSAATSHVVHNSLSVAQGPQLHHSQQHFAPQTARHKPSLQDSAIVALNFKDDDEEEGALPPENPDVLAKLVESPAPVTRRKRRNKKHGRSVSLIGDEVNAAVVAAQDNYLVPMSARGPTPSKRSSFGSFAVPRLSIASPWPTSDTLPYPSHSYTSTASAASTSELKDTRSDSNFLGANVDSALRRNPHSESALSDLTMSSIDNESQGNQSLSSARSARSDKSTKFEQRLSSSSAPTSTPAPLVHRSGRDSSSDSIVLPSPRSRTMFEEALEQSQAYSSSIDSLSPDNYQISLTSVNSGDEEVPDHIMSAAALARIKGHMKKSSSSVRANDVFNPVLDTVSESSDDSLQGSSRLNASRESRSSGVFAQDFDEHLTLEVQYRHRHHHQHQNDEHDHHEHSDQLRSHSESEMTGSYSSVSSSPSNTGEGPALSLPDDGPSINLSSSGPSDGPSIDLDY